MADAPASERTPSCLTARGCGGARISAAGMHLAGEHAHEAYFSASVHKHVTALCNERAERYGGLAIGFADPIA